MQIVLASRNEGKIKEIQAILTDLPINLLSLADFPQIPPIEEDGDSFLANALKKAQLVSQFTGKWTLADDSGLQVKALNGAPGIHSARYASPSATDAENIQKLLSELKKINAADRSACFKAVIVLVGPHSEQLFAEGTVEGIITEQPRGNNGFGYDPVFYLPRYQKTMAELPPEIKNTLSHRYLALKRIKEKLCGEILSQKL